MEQLAMNGAGLPFETFSDLSTELAEGARA
jgi:hypothetical protein